MNDINVIIADSHDQLCAARAAADAQKFRRFLTLLCSQRLWAHSGSLPPVLPVVKRATVC